MVRSVGVIGAGTMGRGIAETLAHQGFECTLIDRTTADINRAKKSIENSLHRQIEKWALTEVEMKVILSRIHFSTEMVAVKDTDYCIESVSENLSLKKEIFKKLDSICSERVILASNTSTLSLTEIAAETNHPERVIGLHFLHPVVKIDLVEIIKGLKTSNTTVDITIDFVKSMKKIGVQVFESPGFVTTRLILTLINEAIHTLLEGVATAKDIDTAMRIGYDFKYGPLELADRMGLDSIFIAMERLFREYGDLKYRPPVLLKKMVRAGHKGSKTGEGFFRYNEDGDRIYEEVQTT